MGLGRACAESLASEGAAVMLADRETDEGDAAARAVMANDGNAAFLAHDAPGEEDWLRVLEQTVARFARLDILVNNAGRDEWRC